MPRTAFTPVDDRAPTVTIDENGDAVLHGSRGDAVTMKSDDVVALLALHDKGSFEGMCSLPDGGAAMWLRDAIQVLYPKEYLIFGTEMAEQLSAQPKVKR